MRFVAKRIDDQDFHARDKIDNRIRYGAAVAQVGDKFLVRAREKVAVHNGIAMRHGQRSDKGLA